MDRLGVFPHGRDGRKQTMRTPDEVSTMQRLHELGWGHAADCGGGRVQSRDGAAVSGCGCLDAVPNSDPPWPPGGAGCLAM